MLLPVFPTHVLRGVLVGAFEWLTTGIDPTVMRKVRKIVFS